MNKPTKLLIVVMDFWQAGAERFAFEVDAALNKNIFTTSILSVRNLNTTDRFNDYYYEKHLQLESRVFFLDHIKKIEQKGGRVSNKIKQLFKGDVTVEDSLERFFKEFDVIAWMGEYTFVQLHHHLSDDSYSKSVIHLMNARFQGVPTFKSFPKDRHYTFTSGYDDQKQVAFELSDFSDYKHVLFPLSLQTRNLSNNWKYNNSEKKKIGVFTRLDAMKPLDPFIYAYHLLLDIIPKTELHIFGSGDPVSTGMRRFAEHLGIENSVHFRGHQDNIVETAKNESLNLIWFQGYKNRPAGYAGFDICTTGIPQVFWEFTVGEKGSHAINETYPIYKNLRGFVSKSASVLTDPTVAAYLSFSQFTHVLQYHDIDKNIAVLEELYLQLAIATN